MTIVAATLTAMALVMLAAAFASYHLLDVPRHPGAGVIILSDFTHAAALTAATSAAAAIIICLAWAARYTRNLLRQKLRSETP